MNLRRADLATLFGLPLVLDRADAEELVADLRALVERQLRRAIGTIESDLDALSESFDPGRPGSSLRDALTSMPPPPPVRSRLVKRSELLIDPDGASLVGPEARVALEVLSEELSDEGTDPIVVPVSAPCVAQAELYARYRDWAVRRIENALSLGAGKADTMRPLTAAWLLFLLVNGSKSPETAVSRPLAAVDQARLEGAIGRVLHAFSDAVAASKRSARPFGLESNWVLSEASRRAPGVVGEHRRRAGEPKLHYIRVDGERRTVDIVARELSRRRRPPSRATVLAAFDGLVREYRRQIPILASAGMAHESRAATRQIQLELERALDRHAAVS